ncbi:hypothetical protein BDV93DRAFT_606082 [Ceratobasidium sp. AG-I]|nr:hypothetical protein BDV93DRAFT_606082 [Ceratobasidium sp. AG-I]
MREKQQPMLPSPGGPRLSRSPSNRGFPVCPRMFSRSLLRRRRFYGLLAIFGLALYYLRVLASSLEPFLGYETAFKEEEDQALGLGSYEDSGGRYLHFKVEPHARVDEALANLLLHAHLAHVSDRAFVFDPLEPIPWDRWQMFSKRKVIPLTAIFDARKLWEGERGGLQPVSAIGWQHVCPRRDRTVLRVLPEDLESARYNPGTLMSTWADKLKKTNAHCVEIVGELFTERVLEYPAIQGLYDTIAASPILNRYVFSSKIDKIASDILPISTEATSSPTANNTLVLHAYLPPPPPAPEPLDLCSIIAARDAPFRTFAHLRDLPTPFVIPAAPTYYAQRCNPSVTEIIGRLGAMRTATPSLQHIYVVDGPLGLGVQEWADRKRWFEQLRYELTTKYEWKSVRWARAGAKAEAVAIDTELAVRGAAFMGNGFSDFSSNVVLMRLTRGSHKGSIRFL